jgi:hypothetical protein
LKAKSNFGSFTWIRQDAIVPGRLQTAIYRLGQSRGLHHSPLDNDAKGDIFPQRDQQLSRQCDDGGFLQPTAIALDAFLEP